MYPFPPGKRKLIDDSSIYKETQRIVRCTCLFLKFIFVCFDTEGDRDDYQDVDGEGDTVTEWDGDRKRGRRR